MINFTKQRKMIYDTLKENDKPLSIENLFYMLPEDSMNLSTVYRTIEYFQSYDLLLKFHFNETTYYILNDNSNHHHYSICTSCLSMSVIDCKLDSTIANLNNDDFLVTNHEMTIYGLCKICQ